MDRQELARRLLELPEEIGKLEIAYYEALSLVKEATYRMEEKASELLLSGKIDGKTEKIRDAQLFPYLKHFMLEKLEAERDSNQKKERFYTKKREADHLQYIVRLLE